MKIIRFWDQFWTTTGSQLTALLSADKGQWRQTWGVFGISPTSNLFWSLHSRQTSAFTPPTGPTMQLSVKANGDEKLLQWAAWDEQHNTDMPFRTK